MADYTPLFLPGDVWTSTASGTITGGQPVAVSGNGTVAAAGATSAAYIGVAAHDAVNGQRVSIHLGKVIHEGIADGTVTAGDQLVTTNTASRHVKTQAVAAGATAGDINNARSIIGVALTTGADNVKVFWATK